jgi:hypothetical protein
VSLCPCCSHQLVRQISRQRLYWFCSSCRQEMPNFAQLNLVGKTLTSVPSESEKRSLQRTHFNKNLDASHQLYETSKPALCIAKSPLATTV